MFEPGDKIDDVEILARLRAGGMAALYLGRRAGAGGFSKDVAVKVIHTHLASDMSFVEMFVDEARLSARIDHPNVVRVEALKEHKGAYCLLMEFVHGCSLSQLMGTLKDRDRRFSPELAVAIAVRVADGLHAAHELLNPDGSAAGVVHRDVSPANVLVGYRGDVKLIDFGIAKATQRLHQTEAAGLKGKIAYMAPEQAFGRDVDRRCDVYALGIVLWELLTMRRLFKADNDLRLLDIVRTPKVVPPGAVVPDIPPALDRVVLEALAADREHRPMSTRELRHRLLDALPAAATIDPLQISAVVCEVMSEKIQEEREILSLSSFNVLPSGRDSVTVSRLLRAGTSGVEVAVEDLAHGAQELAASLQHVRTEARPSPPSLLHHESPPSVPGYVPAQRRVLPVVLGVAAVVGLLVGVGFGVAFAFRASDADPSDQAALPPVQAQAPAPAAPTLEPPPTTLDPQPLPAPPPPVVVALPEPPPPVVVGHEAAEPAPVVSEQGQADDDARGRRNRRPSSRDPRPSMPEVRPLAPDPVGPRPGVRRPGGITTQEI